MVYEPFEAVVADREAPVSTLLAITVALGITAPVGSVTMPVIAPVVSDA